MQDVMVSVVLLKPIECHLGKFLAHQQGIFILGSPDYATLLYSTTLTGKSTTGRINSPRSLTKGSLLAKTVRIPANYSTTCTTSTPLPH